MIDLGDSPNRGKDKPGDKIVGAGRGHCDYCRRKTPWELIKRGEETILRCNACYREELRNS